MMGSVTHLNRIGAELAQNHDVHAITDVTGFGILGHGLEMARGSGLTLTVDRARLPLFREAVSLAQKGYVTGASTRNWDSYGDSIDLPVSMEAWQRQLLTDPQTSGGLLVACASNQAEQILESIVEAGYRSARIVGHAEKGPAQVRVI
jgi:selenide,water dikinase